MPEVLLTVDKLTKHFPITRGTIRSQVVATVKAVDGIAFSINTGKTLALVGESGCGKTTTAKLVLRLLTPSSGSVTFGGRDIATMNGRDLKWYRAKVQAVFQDPYTSLNPRMKVNAIIAEPMEASGDTSGKPRTERIEELLNQVGLGARCAKLFPHELSGGQRQRVAIARALSVGPQLVVLDEPVSSLDVSMKAQIMNVLYDLQVGLRMTNLLIAHELGTVRYLSHQVAVMYLGRIVEMGPTEELFTNPQHPYTHALLSAALTTDPDALGMEIVLSGEAPSPIKLPTGCRFHPRCFRVQGKCKEIEPTTVTSASGHQVVCHFPG